MNKMVIIHSSGDTEKMAKAIEDGAKSILVAGNIIRRYASEATSELADADAIVLGSLINFGSKLDDHIVSVLKLLRGFNLTGKIGAAFVSHTLLEDVLSTLINTMKEFGMDVLGDGIKTFDPNNPIILQECYKLGQDIATILQQGS